MSLPQEKVPLIRSAVLPPVELRKKIENWLLLRHIAAPEERLEVTAATALRTHAGRAIRVELRADRVTTIVGTRGQADLFSADGRELITKELSLTETTLNCGRRAEWLRHPGLPPTDLDAYRERIRSSWRDSLSFVAEKIGLTPEDTVKGLRPPQIGALHALAAHWTVYSSPALVVMPTGTGKTEVMLASMVMTQPKRLLVLVPSDPLRQQTVAKFISLGVLPETAALRPCIRPIVGVLLHVPPDATAISELNVCNVVISTVAMLERTNATLLRRFLEQFDAVYFDEAHHLPAISWERIHERLDNHRVVQFTATPFRMDGRRVPGRIIYQFPLRLAQQQGYFRPIKFLEVDESDRDEADRLIAARAVEQLRTDRANELAHILLARADTREKADKLYREIYQPMYGEFQPVLIHTGIRKRSALIEAIRAGLHQIVVCVDMFGEGFDLPNLKIAAMHSVHGSLAIALQFTGRFTRSAPDIGSATLVANIADVRVHEAIEDLYAEDADWNQLIPELSAKAIQTQLDFSDFLERMEPEGTHDEALFDLNILRPKTSTVIYRIGSFTPRLFRKGLRKGTRVHRVWKSRDRDMLVFVIRTRPPIDWAIIKETTDEKWDLFVLAHDEARQLLFIHSSQKGTLHGELARAVGGEEAQIISGEAMFRAFDNVNRLIFHNVGLYGRGKLRFRMFTGLDVGELISPTAQAGGTKSNLFAVGYEDGSRVTVGASFKGRVWSMSKSSIPEWRQWCDRIADKILNDNIRTNGFLRHTLIPEQITAIPTAEVFTVLLPDEWLVAEEDFAEITWRTKAHVISEVGITDWSKTAADRIVFTMTIGLDEAGQFEVRWGPTEGAFRVAQLTGDTIRIRHRSTDRLLTDFFSENFPVLLMIDGSEIRGGFHFKKHETHPFTFAPQDIQSLDWSGVPITQESKWKNGQMRPASVQGRLIDERVNAFNMFVIDDDDAGEAADVVEIGQVTGEFIFRLHHCKYASGSEAGARVRDLYEVCGQAVRSARLAANPQGLIRHLERRETAALLHGRATRFEKGDLKGLRTLRRQLRRRRSRFEISIVQPGLSRAQLSPDLASVLGAADTYIREFTGSPLIVYGSA